MIRTASSAALATLALAMAAPAAAQDWSGLYVGVYGAHLESHDNNEEYLSFDRNLDGDFRDTVRTSSGADAFSPGSCNGSPSTTTPVNCDDDSSGVEGGIRAGYDQQFGPWVVGVVGDLSALQLEDSVTSFSTTPASYTFTRHLDTMAAVRARVGYAVGGRGLIYATAGVASGEVDNSFSTTNTANSFTEVVDDDNADGWQAGSGIEWRLAPNLTFVTEYLYTKLETDYVVRVGNNGSTPATNPFISAPNTTGTDMRRNNEFFRFHALRIGMNVQF